jgi:adenylate cyclase
VTGSTSRPGLEALAEPGAICVSAAARDHVGNKLPLAFDDLGDQQVKNIPVAIRVYRVQTATPTAEPTAALPLPYKPSIAVLPFQNMSGDPEQEYFVDGMVEEIIPRCPASAGSLSSPAIRASPTRGARSM